MLESNNQDQYVSLAEVLEVRNAKLSEFEILILLLAASDHLINVKIVEDVSHVFTLEQIFITSDGQIKV
jgi:hypothetical protein